MAAACRELCEQLAQSDERAVMRAILGAGGRCVSVRLVEGELSLEDTLAYARVMMELGCPAEAEELVAAAVEASFAHRPNLQWTQGSHQTM